MINETRVIKKYPNRRLYDTHTSQYITLSDIHKLIINDISFSVVDSKTDADLTRATLLQILSDQEQSANPMLSIDLLQKLIQVHAAPMHHILSRYYEHCIEIFMEHQVALKSPMNSILGTNTQVNQLHAVAQESMNSWLEKPIKLER
jgi:polyhydroxyalkanoate synthesis repressor PhaR